MQFPGIPVNIPDTASQQNCGGEKFRSTLQRLRGYSRVVNRLVVNVDAQNAVSNCVGNPSEDLFSPTCDSAYVPPIPVASERSLMLSVHPK